MDVVIGAAFGDEGKGLMTHYFASRYGRDAIVVRFNGGAQAGHTVVTEEGKRHVFHHIGSGTFAGAATYLSEFFVSNPVLFLEEIKELKLLGITPKVCIHPDSLITTPYDMMINQMVEENRGQERHGSCGVGFAETIERNLNPLYALKMDDLENFQKVRNILSTIQKQWVPLRLKALNFPEIPESWKCYIESEDIMQLYLHQLACFLEAINITCIDLAKASCPIIFEGAQGLMLDQERGWFPHVTRSHTGLTNVMQLIKGSDNQSLNVIYVARSYLTRHGAGPLPHELSTLPYQQVVDNTNVTNAYQGSLRYAWFNLPLLKKFIEKDLAAVPKTIKVNHQLAVTCLDQTDEQLMFVNDNKIRATSHASFLNTVAQEVKASSILGSYGPTIQTLQQWQA